MGLLAYDPERVGALRARLRWSIEELHGWRTSDPVAVHAHGLVRAVASALAPFDARLAATVSCTALTDRLRLDAGDLATATAHVMQRLYGWEVIDDPLDGPVDISAEARALGWLLAHGDLDELLSPAQLAVLAERLRAFVADPTAAAGFLANLGDAGLVGLLEALATRRLRGLGRRGDPAKVTAIDAVVRSLGGAIAARSPRVTSALPDLFPRLTPYAAAMLLPHLGLDARHVGRIGYELLARWRRLDLTGTSPADRWAQGPTTGDLVFTALLETDGAPTEFLHHAVHDPLTLMATAFDPLLAHEVAVRATSPEQISTAEAAELVPPLLRYLQRSYHASSDFWFFDPDHRQLAARVASPWLLQLTTRAHDWSTADGWSYAGDGRPILDDILADEAARHRLIAEQQRWLDAAPDLFDSSWADALAELEDLMGMLTALDERFLQADIREAAGRRTTWDVGWRVVDLAAAALVALTPLGPGAAGVVNSGRGLATSQLRGLFEHRRWLDAPADHETARLSAQHQLDVRVASQGAALVVAVAGHFQAAGLLPANVPPPPGPDEEDCTAIATRRRIDDWLSELPPGLARDRLSDVARAVLNDSATTAACG